MKRRDFLKVSLSAGAAATMPAGVLSLSSCSDNIVDGPDISGTADLLILGNIVTVDENHLFAEAMTIKNGYVQYVGNEATARKFCTPGKTVERKYDAGLTIYPGFMEAHCHGASAGLIETTCKLFDYNSFKEYQDAIKAYIANDPGKPYYRISGWRNVNRVTPTAKILDEVSPEGVLIFGGSMDGHCFWMNTAAMEEFGVTDPEFYEKYTLDEVPRDANGPVGYFAEAAAADINKAMPITEEAAEQSIELWEQFALKNGYVAATEAGVNLNGAFHEAYIAKMKKKELKIRTRAFWNVIKDEASEKKVKYVEDLSKKYNDEYYKIIGLKVFIDGVVESHTALLTEPYTDKSETYGLDRYKDTTGDPDATLKQLVLTAHQHHLPTHTHTIGDGAVKKMLDAIEYAKSVTGDYSIRDMLAHLEIVRTEDIKRFAKLNVSAVVSSLWAPKEAITPFIDEERLLGSRASTNYQIMNSFVEMGVNCAQHTDYPVSQSVDVPRAIYCGVTRRLPPDFFAAGVDTVRLAQEAVTRLEMLKELTINVAKLWNEEHHLGSLTPGKVANYVVYDCDFIDDDVEAIPYAHLHQVVIDGKEVYNAPKK